MCECPDACCVEKKSTKYKAPVWLKEADSVNVRHRQKHSTFVMRSFSWDLFDIGNRPHVSCQGGNGDHAQERWRAIFLPFVWVPAHITLSPSSRSLCSGSYTRTAPRLHLLTLFLLFPPLFIFLAGHPPAHRLICVGDWRAAGGDGADLANSWQGAHGLTGVRLTAPPTLELTLTLLEIPIQMCVIFILFCLPNLRFLNC